MNWFDKLADWGWQAFLALGTAVINGGGPYNQLYIEKIK